MASIQQLILTITFFIGNVLIPFLFAVALLVFLYNATRYFIIGGHNEEDRDKAKRLSLYALLAFVFLVSIWGIVNMFVGAFGFGRNVPLNSDYIETQSPSWFFIGFNAGYNWSIQQNNDSGSAWDAYDEADRVGPR